MLIESRRLNTLFKNAMVLFVGSKFQAVFLFLQSVIIARTLGVKDYGKWAIVVAFCGLLMNFISLKTGDVLGKYLTDLKYNKRFDMLYYIIRKTIFLDILTKGIAFLLIIILSRFINEFLKGPENTLIYTLYGFSLFLGFIDSAWFSLERESSNYKNISIISIIHSYIRVFLVIIIFFLFKSIGLVFLSIAFLLSSILMFIIKIYRINMILKIDLNISLKTVISKKNKFIRKNNHIIKEVYDFLRATFFSTFFSSLIKKMDVLAVGYFFSSETVGFLKLAKNLSRIIQDIAINVLKPLYKEFNEIVASKKEKKILIMLKKYFIYYMGLLLIILSAINFLIKPFILFFYGKEFLVSASFFTFYLVIVFVILTTFWANPLLLALKGWRFKLNILMISFVLMTLLIMILNYYFGLYGLLTAFILARLFTNTSFVIYVIKKINNT